MTCSAVADRDLAARYRAHVGDRGDDPGERVFQAGTRGADPHRLGAHERTYALAVLPVIACRKRGAVAGAELQQAILRPHLDDIEDIGGADEARDESGCGFRVDFARRSDLAQAALVQDRDAVRHHHRLLLIVRNHDRGNAEFPLQAHDLRLHLAAQVRIEAAKRLIQKQHGRAGDERAGEADALLLSAGQLARQAIVEPDQAHHLERFGDARAYFFAWDAPHLQAECDIAEDRQMREQREVLEHDADVALVRRNFGDLATADHDGAAGKVFETRDDAQDRRFPAAARAQQHKELADGHVERHAAHRLHGSECVVDVGDPHRRRFGHLRGRSRGVSAASP